MLRLFITLFSVVILATLTYWFGISGFSNSFGSSLDEIRMREVNGIIAFLDEKIIDLTLEQRNKKLSEIQSIFKTEISLLPLDELPNQILDLEKKQLLVKNKMLSIQEEIGGGTYFYLSKIDNHFWALKHLSPMSLTDRTFLDGPLIILNQQLATIPKEHWQQEINRISSNFTIPIEIVTLEEALSDPIIKEERSLRLKSGETVLIYKERELVSIFRRINQSKHVIKIRYSLPPSEAFILKYIPIIAFVILSLLIAGATWLWLRYIWRDLSHLNKASQEFGEGQLEVRVKEFKYSLIGSSLKSFNKMATQIEKLIASHKMLTNAVSHELRTPISSLQLGVDMLEKTDNEQDKARYIASINTDIEELNEMLGELLTYARLDRLNVELHKKPVILKTWLEQHIEYWRLHCNHIEITFKHEGLNDNDVSYIDEKLMTRALHNLIQNACRYAKHEIQIKLKHEKGHYVMSVEDDGLGVPKDYQDSIFEPFSRVDDSRARESGGYGLGLAIVKQVTKAHQGIVSLDESKLGGAKFIIQWDG